MLYALAASGLLAVSIFIAVRTACRTARVGVGVRPAMLDSFGWALLFFTVAVLSLLCSALSTLVSKAGLSGALAVYSATAVAQAALALAALLFAKFCKIGIVFRVSAFEAKEGVKYFFPTLSALLCGAGVGIFYKLFTGADPVRQAAIDIFLDSDGFGRILALASVALFAPIAEELFFRGMLYPVMKGFFESVCPSAKKCAAVSAALAVSAMFSAIHAELFAALPIFLVGIILTCAYERTGSIATPVIAHSLFNIVNLAVVSAPEICDRL